MIQFFLLKHSDKTYFIYNAFRSWKVSWTWKEEGDDASRNHEQEKTEEKEEDVEDRR